MQRHRATRKGFTLIEIVTVAALIALLCALALPALNSSRDTSRHNRARADLRILSTTVDRLYFDTGAWPGGERPVCVAGHELWDLNAAAAGITTNDGRFIRWQGPYLHRVPTDPWGSRYFFDPDYRIHGRFHAVVGSFGANRRGPNLYDDDDLVVPVEEPESYVP